MGKALTRVSGPVAVLAIAALGSTCSKNAGEVTPTKGALATGNGLAENGLTTNGLWTNGLWTNGLRGNGANNSGLGFNSDWTSWCGQPVPGGPTDLTTGKWGQCDETCQRWVSACVLARTNAYGVHVPISLRAPAGAPQAIRDALAV